MGLEHGDKRRVTHTSGQIGSFTSDAQDRSGKSAGISDSNPTDRRRAIDIGSTAKPVRQRTLGTPVTENNSQHPVGTGVPTVVFPPEALRIREMTGSRTPTDTLSTKVTASPNAAERQDVKPKPNQIDLGSVYEQFSGKLEARIRGQFGTTLTQSEISDVLSDTWVSAVESSKSYQPREGATIESWISRIATNKAINVYRANKRHDVIPVDPTATVSDLPRESILGRLRDTDPSPEDTAISHLGPSLGKKLGNIMPEEMATAVIAAESEGIDYKEIAELMGSSIGTVSSRVARGRNKLLNAAGITAEDRDTREGVEKVRRFLDNLVSGAPTDKPAVPQAAAKSDKMRRSFDDLVPGAPTDKPTVPQAATKSDKVMVGSRGGELRKRLRKGEKSERRAPAIENLQQIYSHSDAAVIEALSTILRPTERTVLEKVIVAGVPREQVAEEMHVDTKTIMKHLQNAESRIVHSNLVGATH